jgi:hypothetical protein
MASQYAMIDTAITNLTAKLAELSADPKPSYSVDGQTFSHTEYFKMLTDSLESLITTRRRLQGPYQLMTRVGSL